MSDANENSSKLPVPPLGGGGGLEIQVRRIQDKLQQVLRQRESLLKENAKLKEALREIKEASTSHTGQLEQLQKQVEILKASKGEMDPAEKKTLERRLGQYIREIDRCIALLSE
jgi:septal ring factor EnvC (AmiA/AmiB activator)